MPADPFADYLAKIETAHQLGNDTEHTHRPALKDLLEVLASGVTATNEPKRVQVGAPDYVITRPSGHGPLTLGYAEAKDIDVSLADIERDANRAEPTTINGKQLKRYRGGLANLLFTDYLEFRWYTEGALRQTARLAGVGAGKKLVRDAKGVGEVRALLDNFLNHQPEPITKPQELALRMARLTHIIRDIIIEAFDGGEATPLLKDWRKAFADVLITDLDQPLAEKTAEFADMFAQTLAYGLFSARVMDPTPENFNRQEAQYLIPPTNPFLRRFFIQISGPDLDGEPYGGFVNDLAALLEQTDMGAVLAHFGKRTRQEDPVVHFYETFLAAYDPKLRESRGVYYTPEPVVSYIVRSVDHLLKTRFGCSDGLADSSKVTVANPDPLASVKGAKQPSKVESHRVLLLDPACGTGTFLYSVIDLIRAQFMKQGNAGMWSDYVRQHLLPRLFGFELLMAPYAVAHFKLGLQLAGRDLPESERAAWAYDFASGERLGVYLTNTLEGPHEYSGLPLFTQFLADETDAANSVKRDKPIMVVLGNPPYSGHSANKGAWISGLLRGKDVETGKPTGNYFAVDGAPLGEKNPKWLNDDYVKFIRFSQWRIERSGAGILAFISNNGYLDNPTFRGMRQSLMQTFSDIYILDLHGSSKKQERSPDGTPDQNVFDIQQGVAIGLFVKEAGKAGPARVHHADLWGLRESKDKQSGKYPWLFEHDIAGTDWRELLPQPPFYVFVPQDIDIRAEYEQGCSITEVFPINTVGVVTGQDSKTIAMTYREAEGLAQEHELPTEAIATILYRPFDRRSIVYDSKVVTRQRLQVMRHMLSGANVGLITTRQTRDKWDVFATEHICGHKTCSAYDINSLFPLYLYPDATKKTPFDTEELSSAPGGRRPNLNPAFIADMEARLGMAFVQDGKGDLGLGSAGVSTFKSEDAGGDAGATRNAAVSAATGTMRDTAVSTFKSEDAGGDAGATRNAAVSAATGAMSGAAVSTFKSEDAGGDAGATRNAAVSAATGATDATIQTLYRGRLPHWEMKDGIYFVTFRLADSLPQTALREIEDERNSIIRAARQSSRSITPDEHKRLKELTSDRIEEYLDSGVGACHLADPRIAGMVADTLRYFDGKRYRLFCWCVMPNHVHVVMRLFSDQSLAATLHSWKSYSAKEANRILGAEGAFWQREYYDRLIRNEEEFYRVVEYVAGNPEKVGLRDWRWVEVNTGGIDDGEEGQEAAETAALRVAPASPPASSHPGEVAAETAALRVAPASPPASSHSGEVAAETAALRVAPASPPASSHSGEVAAETAALRVAPASPPASSHSGEVAAETAALRVAPASPPASSHSGEVAAETAALRATFGPEDVFNYMYAVFHSPTYRSRYAEFLKIDFPRLPLTSDAGLFRRLCDLGGQLVGLHLMEQHAPTIVSYPVPGDSLVERVSYTGPGQGADKGRVWINKTQYFEGVPPQVWEFHIGGYQVAEKWLKDRKGRRLSYDDLSHYMRVVAALAETMRLMGEVDGAVREWPIV